MSTGNRLAGRSALVTGGGRGIGLAIARRYLEEGARVFICGRDPARLEQARESLAPLGEIATHACDLADPSALQDMFAAATAWTGGLDILVNNAGVYLGKPFTGYSMAEFDSIMRTNVYAVFELMQLALAHMQPRGRGKIVNIASTAGKWESLNQSAYNASKHAVVALTRCAALENARHPINVNAICPGMVSTDMFGDFEVHATAAGVSLAEYKEQMLQRIPMGRFLEAEEVAHIAVYLASSESDGMTGQTITISGGMRMG